MAVKVKGDAGVCCDFAGEIAMLCLSKDEHWMRPLQYLVSGAAFAFEPFLVPSEREIHWANKNRELTILNLILHQWCFPISINRSNDVLDCEKSKSRACSAVLKE